MKFAIIDDVKKETEILDDYITRFEKEWGIAVVRNIFQSPVRFLESYSYDYDLIFLDIEMPGLNGIETAREIRRMDPNVLIMFITNMAQYALNGYEVEAVDYVLKPLTYHDFLLKLQKALRYIEQRKDDMISVVTNESAVRLRIRDIFYVEVDKHYLIYHTSVGMYTVRGTMKEIQEQLTPYHFVRCSHSFLVNLRYVESVNGNILKCGGDEIQISRNKKSEFMYEFTRYISGM